MRVNESADATPLGSIIGARNPAQNFWGSGPGDLESIISFLRSDSETYPGTTRMDRADGLSFLALPGLEWVPTTSCGCAWKDTVKEERAQL
jgi:hypothetical protein